MPPAIVAHQREPTNATLAAALGAELLSPAVAVARMHRGELALARIDVRHTLDGCEPGIDLLEPLAGRGVHVLNRARALLAVHDKLKTARRLSAAGIPHPETQHITSVQELLELEPPLVVKPRFGSWGTDVVRCRDRAELEAWGDQLRRRVWFRQTGALVQELLPLAGHDLRLLVAGGRVFGAVERVARPGEWRTNVSLGGGRRAVDPAGDACELGLAAAAVLGIDVAGVDLYPVGDSYVVLELNGAADFDDTYSLPGRDVYADLREAIGLVPVAA